MAEKERERLTVASIRELAKAGKIEMAPDEKAGEQRVAVRVLIKAVKDSGVTHREGDVFGMEISLAAVHVNAGQVELVRKGDKPKAT